MRLFKLTRACRGYCVFRGILRPEKKPVYCSTQMRHRFSIYIIHTIRQQLWRIGGFRRFFIILQGQK